MSNNQTSFESALETIGQALYDYEPSMKDNDSCIKLLENVGNAYLLVEWPESQNYMEEDWFEEEAVLALGAEDRTGGSAYFIPLKRLI